MHRILILTICCLFTILSAKESYVFLSSQQIAVHLSDYNEDELEAIEQDLNVVRSVCFPKQTTASDSSERPLYIATAGGPGARKSTILERHLERYALHDSIAYLDPDQRGLKFMVHTYYAQSLSAKATANYSDYLLARKAAYEKWRGASNYIALSLLEEAFAQQRNIAYGTTSTGDHTGIFLQKAKEAGYHIVLLLCSCEDAVRVQAVRYRNEEQKFYQSTPEDALKKGKLFPQRFQDYLSYADTLYLYWSDDLFQPERLAAILDQGKVEVLDAQALSCFIEKYEADRALLAAEGITLPSWNTLMRNYQEWLD